MKIPAPNFDVDIDYNELGTLKQIAEAGALDQQISLSCSDLADQLEVSAQTASRRLRTLDQNRLIDREYAPNGQRVRINKLGAGLLQSEGRSYNKMFDGGAKIALSGSVTSGSGEARQYLTLSGYLEQFKTLLGYEPYPGTLNIDLNEESVKEREQMSTVDSIGISSWEDEDRTYGSVFCYPATLRVDGDMYQPAHTITPERTHHGKDKLEVLAPDRLRAELELEDGDEVTVYVN